MPAWQNRTFFLILSDPHSLTQHLLCGRQRRNGYKQEGISLKAYTQSGNTDHNTHIRKNTRFWCTLWGYGGLCPPYEPPLILVPFFQLFLVVYTCLCLFPSLKPKIMKRRNILILPLNSQFLNCVRSGNVPTTSTSHSEQLPSLNAALSWCFIFLSKAWGTVWWSP